MPKCLNYLGWLSALRHVPPDFKSSFLNWRNLMRRYIGNALFYWWCCYSWRSSFWRRRSSSMSLSASFAATAMRHACVVPATAWCSKVVKVLTILRLWFSRLNNIRLARGVSFANRASAIWSWWRQGRHKWPNWSFAPHWRRWLSSSLLRCCWSLCKKSGSFEGTMQC